MAGKTDDAPDDGAFEAGPHWAGKTEFMPGVPIDPGDVPERLYQVLLGRVFTLTRWRDGSTARGEVALQDLEALTGGPVTREGWYDALGEFIGAELPGGL